MFLVLQAAPSGPLSSLSSSAVNWLMSFGAIAVAFALAFGTILIAFGGTKFLHKLFLPFFGIIIIYLGYMVVSAGKRLFDPSAPSVPSPVKPQTEVGPTPQSPTVELPSFEIPWQGILVFIAFIAIVIIAVLVAMWITDMVQYRRHTKSLWITSMDMLIEIDNAAVALRRKITDTELPEAISVLTTQALDASDKFAIQYAMLRATKPTVEDLRAFNEEEAPRILGGVRAAQELCKEKDSSSS